MDPFEAFLARKSIAAATFKEALPHKYEAYRADFQITGSVATDYARKFHWNDLRLEFPLQAEKTKKE